jgi:hypothetical protein
MDSGNRWCGIRATARARRRLGDWRKRKRKRKRRHYGYEYGVLIFHLIYFPLLFWPSVNSRH